MLELIQLARRIGRRTSVALALLAISAAPAAAQTDYFWNAPTGGTGNWDLATANWGTAAAGPLNYTSG